MHLASAAAGTAALPSTQEKIIHPVCEHSSVSDYFSLNPTLLTHEPSASLNGMLDNAQTDEAGYQALMERLDEYAHLPLKLKVAKKATSTTSEGVEEVRARFDSENQALVSILDPDHKIDIKSVLAIRVAHIMTRAKLASTYPPSQLNKMSLEELRSEVGGRLLILPGTASLNGVPHHVCENFIEVDGQKHMVLASFEKPLAIAPAPWS